MDSIANNISATQAEAVLINKEDIANLHFPKEDVLLTPEDKKERLKKIERAMHLGNNKIKVKIIFQDVEGKKVVDTSIWGITEQNIILKGTTIIPIRSIHEIKFF
ncbi:MAG TPA: hypothetical protein VIN73_08560 [Vicingaceae bacterium]